MKYEGSSRHDAIELGKLLSLYIEYDNGYAKSELSNKIIEGDELVDALDYANLTFKEDPELEAQYKKLEKIFEIQRKAFLEERKNYKELIKNIESLIKEPLIEKIINLPNIFKSIKYP